MPRPQEHPIDPRPAMDPTLSYPPADPGLPAVRAEDLLEPHGELLARFRGAVGATQEEWVEFYLGSIQSLAREIHLLPASADAHFAGPGGLLCQCLECALHVARAARGRLFAGDAPPEVRHMLEPAWQQAAFLAGLTCELRNVLGRVVVCDAQGRPWPRLVVGIDGWIEQRRLKRYYLSWLPAEGGPPLLPEVLPVIARVLPAGWLARMAQSTPDIVREVHEAGAPTPGERPSVLGELVAGGRQQVLQADLARRPPRWGRWSVGHHLELHLLDAIRFGVESGRWLVDPAGDGRALAAWKDTTLCLAWPDCAWAIAQELDRRGLAGFPRASRTMAECLARAGLLRPADDGRWQGPTSAGPGEWLQLHDDWRGTPVCPRAEVPAHVGPPIPVIVESGSDPIGTTLPGPGPEDDGEHVARWRRAHRAEPGCDVLVFGDGRVAISHRLASASHPDPVRLLGRMRELGWLAHGDWSDTRAHIGLVGFRDGRRAAFVLTAEAARRLRIDS